ncbi:HlyD family efflux transporter periplasmic adaptor subunit [Candidatus Roizmanbacteria bacterium]|nr:HlyD family efflux transporter periplasmic adaptor subunit [Candidatus Roizmanbacteria bacterium]
MHILTHIKQNLTKLFSALLHTSIKNKILFLIILIGIGVGVKLVIPRFQTKKIQYQTAKAAKGTLTTSITASGTISSGNSTNITTAATGTIKTVYVTNGDVVKKGQKIAELTLDEYGLEQQATAWSNYIDTLNAVKTAEKTKDEYDIQMWKDRQAILDAEDAVKTKDLEPLNPATKKEWTLSERTIVDKNVDKAYKAFAESENKYKTADAEIAKARAKVTAALRDYDEVSSIITAPIDGTVNNLSLATGVIISSSSTSKTATSTTASSSDSSNTITSQKIGKIYSTDGQLQATVNLTESDVINVVPNQKVVITLDAYSSKSFTGKVLAVDTSGSVSSGVTSYPVTILLDKTDVAIYPNMAVSTSIITNVKTDVLLIPSAAITTTNNTSTVSVLKNSKVSTVAVTTGSSDDTQTEITSGLSEGDAIITNMISANSASENNTTSSFSSTSKNSSSKSSNKSNSMPGGMTGGGGPPGF